MEFRRVATTTDPFWEAFRRRHPDVDVVLLPPAPEVPTGTAEDVLALRAALAGVADALTVVVPDLVVPLDLRRGERPGLVAGVGRGTARVADGPRVLDALAALLEEASPPWHIRRTDGVVAVLDAARGPLTCRVSWAEPHQVLVVTLTAEHLDVGAAAANELIGAR